MRTVLLLGLVGWFAHPLLAGDFCAVKVSITDQSGRPVQAPTQLLDADGKIVERTESVGGLIEFCDFGFGTHTIRIGENCGLVTITDVRLVYGQPRQYSVVYGCPPPPGALRTVSGTIMDDMPMSAVRTDDGAYVTACSVYLRISSGNGTKIEGAEALGGLGVPSPVRTDRYGRAFFYVASNSTRTIAISASGYAQESIDFPCKRQESIERAIVLRKNP
jgi:hypothetical protein